MAIPNGNTAGESSLLLNRPMHAVAVAPMGWCNGSASPERQPLTASDNTLVQTYPHKAKVLKLLLLLGKVVCC